MTGGNELKSILLGVITILLISGNAMAQKAELRGVWLTNVDSEVLYNSEKIVEAMQFLADHHFNVVYPVVWNKAHTLYPSALMDSLFGERIDPRCVGRDPLQEVIDAAHARGIKVIPWFEFGFATSYNLNGGYLLKIKPDWAARDNAGKLLSKNNFEWMSAYHPEVQQFMIDLVCEVVKNYQVDGVQGDDRLPAQPIEGGYEPWTVSLYRAMHGGNPPPQDYRDPEWQRWRGDRLNEFGKRLYDEVKSLKPQVRVSWAPSVYPWAYDEYLQDWPAWLTGGYADEVIPQLYRYEPDEYRSTVDAMLDTLKGLSAAHRQKIYAGVLMKVGKYRIDKNYLLEAIQYHRAKGLNGEVFFFYEGLREDNGYLAKALLNTVYRQPAPYPGAVD